MQESNGATAATSPAIKIRPATADDLETCAICWGDRRDTYPSIYPLRLRNHSLSQSDRLARNVVDLQAELYDELAVFNVATRVAETTGMEEIMGYVIWQKPGTVEKEAQRFKMPQEGQEEMRDAVQKECDTVLAAKLKEESIRVRSRYSSQGSLWFLHQLFIHPNHQRQGIGKALIEHGFAMIDATREADPNVIIGLTSSPQGQALYRRYGFTDEYWFRPKLQDLNDKGELVDKEVSWPLMIKR